MIPEKITLIQIHPAFSVLSFEIKEMLGHDDNSRRGGTLFLDEIYELSLEIQAKILRVIQEGEIQRIGSEKMLHAYVRLLAATNRNFETEVRAGRFRADLYHRLNVYPIKVPALRERKEGIVKSSVESIAGNKP